MDYELRTLSGADAEADLLTPFQQAVNRGFLEPRPSAEGREHWLANVRADRATLRGAFVPGGDGPELTGDHPVATFVSLPGRLTMPDLSQLPNRMITDVTVRASHRRRGLLRRLMTADLEQAREQGFPIAALTVSEATIYGRFGFGIIGFQPRVELDSSTGYALRRQPTGSVEEVDPRGLWPLATRIFDAFHAGQSGSVTLPAHYRDWVTGAWDPQAQAEDLKLRALLHRDESGEPDGFATFSFDGEDKEPFAVSSWNLVATDAEAYLGLVNQLASLDLVDRVNLNRAWIDDPLPWALIDPRRYKVVRRTDLTWARILDPIACLRTAAWRGSARLTLGVSDPMGFAEGTFLVSVGEGPVEVERTDAAPDVELEADSLSTLLFGAAQVPELVAAGRLRGSQESLRALAEIARTTPTPFSITAF